MIKSNTGGCQLIKEYTESLLEYWKDGHGDMLVLMSELQGFLDCLLMLKLLNEEDYMLIVDNFRDALKAIRKR